MQNLIEENAELRLNLERMCKVSAQKTVLMRELQARIEELEAELAEERRRRGVA